MVVTVFRSRLRPEHADEFGKRKDRMMELATGMPGFVSYKVYVAEDGERCSVIEFETREQLEAWRRHPEHLEAQRVGRERYYEEYTLLVAEPVRQSRFPR